MHFSSFPLPPPLLSAPMVAGSDGPISNAGTEAARHNEPFRHSHLHDCPSLRWSVSQSVSQSCFTSFGDGATSNRGNARQLQLPSNMSRDASLCYTNLAASERTGDARNATRYIYAGDSAQRTFVMACCRYRFCLIVACLAQQPCSLTPNPRREDARSTVTPQPACHPPLSALVLALHRGHNC